MKLLLLTNNLVNDIISISKKRKGLSIMKFYKVICHRGHCGSGHSTEITFAFQSENLLSACELAKKMPSVKHTRMAIFGKEITFEEYKELRSVSAYNRWGR